VKRIAHHKRQISLFLVAILLPATVLVILAGRVMYQDRELAAKRALDQRSAAIDQLRRELTARLEAIKFQEINRMIRSANSGRASKSDNPAVILTARLENDHMVLPWAAAIQPEADFSTDFARHRQEGESREFVKRDYAAAATAYRLALASARYPWQKAEARLRMARTLSKTGNNEEAARQYRALLDDSTEARDEQGVGYGFYAAERLVDTKRELDSVLGFLTREVKGEHQLTLPELYMVRSLADSFPAAQTGELREKLSSRIGQMERVVALANDFPRLRAQFDSRAESDPVWLAYGAEPWLVTMTPPSPPLPSLVVVVSSARAAPPGVKCVSRASEGDLVGEAFPGLRVEWTDKRFLEMTSQSLPVSVWVAGLTLVLGIAMLGGYLLLRDVNRDIRMTEVRSQFIASVSHELKTPLTAIRMFAETLALGRSRDERARGEYLETIVNESERLARLVDNVLDFSKIEQGKKIYRLRPTMLDDVARSAVRAMQFPLAEQGFQLRLSVQEEMPELQADADAMQQAILNLLTNAMKYSGDSREIDLRLATRNGDAVIEVADHGLGMAPDEQKHVFEKFYRAPSHESRLIAGTGLGLTLVAHIAKAHGGRVTVESAPGEGSTFSILIPIEGHA
jgi:signal transduction histidine kinase